MPNIHFRSSKNRSDRFSTQQLVDLKGLKQEMISALGDLKKAKERFTTMSKDFRTTDRTVSQAGEALNPVALDGLIYKMETYLRHFR